MNNEKGGIISNILIVPVGLALMAGIFILGYYVGKYQHKSGQGEIAPPLPEMTSGIVPKNEEFTFYKTLTDKNDRTVSIELTPKPEKKAGMSDGRRNSPDSPGTELVQPASGEKRIELKIEKEAPGTMTPKQPASRQARTLTKKDLIAASSGAKQRYTVQIASYQEKSMAEDEVKRMKKRGYAAFITSTDIAGKGVRYRVRLGSFTEKASAEKLKKTLYAKEGISPMVTLE